MKIMILSGLLLLSTYSFAKVTRETSHTAERILARRQAEIRSAKIAKETTSPEQPKIKINTNENNQNNEKDSSDNPQESCC